MPGKGEAWSAVGDKRQAEKAQGGRGVGEKIGLINSEGPFPPHPNT